MPTPANPSTTEPAKRPAVKLNFTVMATAPAAHLQLPVTQTPQNPMMPQQQASAQQNPQPGSVEFDGQTVKLTIGKETKEWNVADEAFVDVLQGCIIQNRYLNSIEGLDPTQNQTILTQVNCYENSVIYNGQLYLMPSTVNRRTYSIQSVTPQRITEAPQQQALLADIQDCQHYEANKTANSALSTMLSSLEVVINRITTPAKASTVLRGISGLAKNKDPNILINTVSHLTSDDTNLGHHGSPTSLNNIIPASTTPDSLTGEQLRELLTFLEHTEIPNNLIAKKLFQSIVNARSLTQTQVEDRFRTHINPAIKHGVIEKFILGPLKDAAKKLLGDAAQSLSLAPLADAIVRAPDAARSKIIADDVIKHARTIRKILTEINAEDDHDELNRLGEQLDALLAEISLAIPDTRPLAIATGTLNDAQRGEFHKLVHAAKNQIQLKISNKIIKDDKSNKAIVERLKPVLETHQQAHDSALHSNNLVAIRALAPATTAAMQEQLALNKLHTDLTSLEARIDALGKDPDLAEQAKTLKEQVSGNGKDKKSIKDAVTKAIDKGDLTAAQNALGELVATVENLETNDNVTKKISELKAQFNAAKKAWLTAHKAAPLAIKQQWAPVTNSVSAHHRAIQRLLQEAAVDRKVIQAHLDAMQEKIPGIQSALHHGNTVATQWQAELDKLVNAWHDTGLAVVEDGELFRALHPAGAPRADHAATEQNPLALAAVTIPIENQLNLLHSTVQAPTFDITEHNLARAAGDIRDNNEPGLLAQARTILSQLDTFTGDVAATQDATSFNDAVTSREALEQSRKHLQTTAESTLTSGSNHSRLDMLSYAFSQLASIDPHTAAIPATDSLLREQHEALRALPRSFQDQYSRLYQTAHSAGFNNIDGRLNNDNAQFIETAGHLKTLGMIARAAVLLKQVNDVYPENHGTRKIYAKALNDILNALTKDDASLPHLAHNLGLLETAITNNVMQHLAGPVDAVLPQKVAIAKYRRLIAMFDIMHVSPDTRQALQNRITGNSDAELFGAHGETLSDGDITRQTGLTGLGKDNRAFLEALELGLESAVCGLNQVNGTAHDIPGFNSPHNAYGTWAEYQQLLHLVKVLGLGYDKQADLQKQANNNIDFSTQQNQMNYLVDDHGINHIAYSNRAQLNPNAIKNALKKAHQLYLSRQKNNLDKTSRNLDRLKFVASYSVDVALDLTRIANGNLSTVEADELDNIFEQSGHQLGIINEAVTLTQTELDSARGVSYHSRSIADQQARIQALKALETRLLDTQTTIQTQLDKVLANKAMLKTQGKPQLAMSSAFSDSTRITSTNRAESTEFTTPTKRQFESLVGQHAAIMDLATNHRVSFTITTHHGKTAICVPTHQLDAAGKAGGILKADERILNHVDAINRGLPLLDSTRNQRIVLQSSNVAELWMQYYTLIHCGNKTEADISAHFTGNAPTLQALTCDWNLTALEQRVVEIVAKNEAPFHIWNKTKWAETKLDTVKQKIAETHNSMKEKLSTTTNMDDSTQNAAIQDILSNQDELQQTAVPAGIASPAA